MRTPWALISQKKCRWCGAIRSRCATSSSIFGKATVPILLTSKRPMLSNSRGAISASYSSSPYCFRSIRPASTKMRPTASGASFNVRRS